MSSKMDLEAAAQDPVQRIMRNLGSGAGGDPAAELATGMVYFKEGDYGQAYPHLKSAVEIDPGAANIQFMYGQTCLELGHLDEAETALRRAINLGGDFDDSRRLLGRVLSEKGELAQAVDQYALYLEGAANTSQALAGILMSLLDLGRMEEAQDLCLRVIQQRPRFAGAYEALGKVLKRAGDMESAIIFLEKAAELDPATDLIQWELGDAYMVLGQAEKAEACLREVVRRRPDTYTAHMHLGRALQMGNKLNEAIDAFMKSAQLAAKPLEVLGGYFIPAMFAADRIEETEIAIKKAIELPGTELQDGGLYYVLGVVQLMQEHYLDAVANLRRAARLMPSGQFDFMLGVAFWLAGRTEDAEIACARAVFKEQAALPRQEAPEGIIDAGRNEAHGAIKISLPWNLPVHAPSGAYHPLVLAVAARQYQGFDLAFTEPTKSPRLQKKNYAAIMQAFADRIAYLRSLDPPPSFGHIFGFLENRHLPSQLLSDAKADITVLHTAPYTLGQTPWLLHIEMLVTLFWPNVAYGATKYLDIRKHPEYPIVKAYLESDECLGVFTHVRQTYEDLPKLFQNPALADKVHYVPMGLYVPPKVKERVEKAIASKRSSERVRIFFTSSFNQDPYSFYSRGGLYVVHAFLEAAKVLPDIELVIRAPLPGNLRPYLYEEILSHPRIEVIPARLSDEEIIDLYLSADIFMMPSYTVHCHSMAIAMYYGCVCLVSDAPGYEEFADNGVTAVMANGRLGKVYRRDEDTGLVREFYATFNLFDPAYAEEVTTRLTSLCRDHEGRRQIADNARKHALQNFSVEAMQDGFEKVLNAAAERLRKLGRLG
jgi:tetratricopeptide (TPR) repeat protein